MPILLSIVLIHEKYAGITMSSKILMKIKEIEKRCKKRHFNKEVYKNRFCIERTFAWIDKFKRLLIRFERVDTYFVTTQLLILTGALLMNRL